MTSENALRYRLIVRLRRQGVSTAEIARRLGIHVTRVSQIVAGGEPKTPPTPEITLTRGEVRHNLRYLGPADRPPGKRGQHGLFSCLWCGSDVVLSVRRVVYANNTSCGCRARNKE